MLWIHGGGYTIGSASDYKGDRLGQSGEVAMVTTNYRLNVFGFMAHPELKAEDPQGATGGQDNGVVHVSTVKGVGVTHHHSGAGAIPLGQVQYPFKLQTSPGEHHTFLGHFFPLHHPLSRASMSFS